MSAIQRINRFSREEQHALAIAAVDELRNELRQLAREQRGYENDLKNIENERIALSKASQGETGGFWRSIGGGVSSLGSTVSRYANPSTYVELQQKLEGVVDTVLRIMAMFVLRTLILPLVFLFMLLKIFKIIWGVDLQKLITANDSRKKSISQDDMNKSVTGI